MPIRSRIVRLSDKSNQIIQSYLPLNLEKIAESDFVYTLSSTNIDQSEPNLVKMYVTIRYWMTSIMDLIRPELSELSAPELENLIFDFVYTPASANSDQSLSNLATIYMPIRISEKFDSGTNGSRTS